VARRLSALVGAAALVAAGPTAYAATGSPPVTVPDTVTMRAGEGMSVDVTANDSDPDGQQLEVCRVGPSPRAVAAEVEDGVLQVFPSRRARGTYTLTYYACDDSYLTAGTLTVKVKPPAPTLEIVPVGDRLPGPVRLVNTYKNQTFHCQWRPLDSDRVEGKTVVKPLSTVVIRVREAEFQIDCESPRAGYSAVFSVGGLATAARPRP
jgi:Big-like domain-containing protein